MLQLHRHTGAKEIHLLDPEAQFVAPARTGKRQFWNQRPDICGHHVDIDSSILGNGRGYLCGLDVAIGTQQSFGLLDLLDS